MEYHEEHNIMMEEDFQAREEVQKMNKSKQVYKDTITLIKLKMSKADTLIRQYNDKMKECDLLNEELAIIKNDKEDALKKYNQTMEKLTRIELSNSSYKESLETLKHLSESQKIKLDENEKHINQLLFKIKEMEQNIAKFEEDNKTLEQEIKSAKASVKIATKKSVQLKHQATQTLILKTQETSVNTDPIRTSSTKLKMKDKCVITDNNGYGKKEPFPIFCSRCDVLIEPAPVDQILKIMSFNPPLLSECHSPPNSPNLNKQVTQVFEPFEITSFNVTKSKENNLEPIMLRKKKCKSSVNIPKEIEHSSFMEIDSLNRKISKLENFMKKAKKNKKKKNHNCCHQNCCSSKKNIKFIVQLPNQEEIFKYRKREKYNEQNCRFSKRRLNILKRQQISDNKWKIENCSGLKKKRKLPNAELQDEKRLKKKKLLNQEQNTIFECEKDLFSNDELTENCNYSAKSLSPSNLLESDGNSLSFNEGINSDLTEQFIQSENINQLNIKSKIACSIPVSSQISVCNAICQKNLEKENTFPETNSTFSNIYEKNEVLFSDCNLDLRIENKNTNGDLDKVNDEENLEISLAAKLPIKLPNITSSVSVERNKTFFTQLECRRNKNRLSTNSSLLSNATEILEHLPDTEDKSLLSGNCIDNNSTCSTNVQESQKFSTNISYKNISFDQLPCGSATSNIEQTYKNSESGNLNVVEKDNSRLVNKESIKLKMIDVEKNMQSPFYYESSINLPIIEKPQQKESTCSEIPIGNDLLIQLANKQLITDDCQSDLQIKNFEQDISSNEVESNNDDAIISEESSEENTQSPSISKCRISNRTVKTVSKITRKKKLLTIIRNIKKSSKRPISTNKLESPTSQIIDKSSVELLNNLSPVVQPLKEQTSIFENISTDLPTKKQRIAHTPKNLTSVDDELKINNVNENYESRVCVAKTTKKTSNEKSNDKFSSLLEDYDKTCKERIEIERNLKPVDPKILDHKTEVTKNNDYNLVKKINKDYSLRDLSQDLKSSEPQESFISDKNCTDNTMETNFTEKDNKLEVDNKLTNEQEEEVTVMNNEEKTPTIELRSRQVIVNKDCSNTKVKKLSKYQSCPKVSYADNTCLTNSIIVTTLNDFIANFNDASIVKQKKIGIKEYKSNEKFFEEQLELLMQAEWTMDINSKIVENLLDSLDIKTLALFLIEFVSEKIFENEEFDKSHTPPAPMMTRFEQKIVALILSINKIHEEFTDIVIEGIRFKLFKLGKPQMVQVVERLFRILVVLNKIKKDREKVRIFLCDALYCLNIRAINIIYIALTCWAEVLPKYNSNNDILLKTIVHIVMTLEVNKPFPKLGSLRKLLSTYYEYPNSGYKTTVLKDELLKKLQENAAGVNTAVLLLCKKMGPAWSMENIIKGGLKQMIVTQIHPSLYDALTLLGNILRSSPKTDSNNNVGEIIDQLCDVLASNAGSDDLQEGVLSCLLSIGKYKYEQIARFVIKWQSNKKDLRANTKEKLNSFFKSQGAKWWWKFVNNNFPFSKPDL